MRQEDVGKYKKTGNYTAPEHPAFKYHTSDETGEMYFMGNYGIYPGSGFYTDIVNYTDAVEVVKYLQDKKWVDVKTRAVFIDFGVYNPNLVSFEN